MDLKEKLEAKLNEMEIRLGNLQNEYENRWQQPNLPNNLNEKADWICKYEKMGWEIVFLELHINELKQTLN